MKFLIRSFICIVSMLIWASPLLAYKVKIKDLCTVQSVRTNAVMGFGLVIGLQATGDSKASLLTNKAIKNLLLRFGMKPDEQSILSQNIAAVVVTADLATYARNGDRLDVKVSAVGDAKSLAGGTLLLTQLRAPDQEVYLTAQGSVHIPDGTIIATSGHVLQGGVVEKEFIPSMQNSDGKVTLSLKQGDFTTSSRVAFEINHHLRGFYAKAQDPHAVNVEVPEFYKGEVNELIAEIESLEIEVDQKAVVVINQKTGTIVMGSQLRIAPVVISHGDLSLQVASPDSKVALSDSLVKIDGSSIGDLVTSLNALGVKPKDVTAILQAMHSAGALAAEIRML